MRPPGELLIIDSMSPSGRRTPTARSGLGLLAGALALAGAFALASCSDDSEALGADATEVEVSLGRFVIDPSEVTVPAGDLRLRVTNTDPELAHDLVVYGKGTRRLAPGESQNLDIPDVAAGQYRMWCDVPGHAEAGQTGTLVVNP